MTALLIAAVGLVVAVIGNAIIDPSPRSMPPLFCGRARSAPAEPVAPAQATRPPGVPRAPARLLLWHPGGHRL